MNANERWCKFVLKDAFLSTSHLYTNVYLNMKRIHSEVQCL